MGHSDGASSFAGLGKRYRLVAAFQFIVRIRSPLCRFTWFAARAVCSVQLYLVSMAADCELVSWADAAFDHADAIDADAIGAAQVAHHQIVMNLCDTAMSAGNFARVDLDIALRMSAEQQDRLIQKYARAVVECD
jgi:hypothetical protein